MSIRKLDIVHHNENEMRCMLRISLMPFTKDLYIIDKSFDKFHISIHKSGNVSLTFQKQWRNRRNIRLTQFEWNLLEQQKEKEKPFLLYFPISIERYPLGYKQRSRTATIMIKEDVLATMLKFFMIHSSESSPKSRESDLGVTVNRIVKISEDEEIHDEACVMKNPSLLFLNHRIRFSMAPIQRLESECNRMLFIFQPSHDLSITNIIESNEFVINDDMISRNGFFFQKYSVSGHEVVLLVY